MQDRLNSILTTRRSLQRLVYGRSSFSLSLAIHLAAVLFLFLGPVLFAEKRQNWEYVDVQVVPATALPQPAPSRTQDPPRREERPAPPEPEPELPEREPVKDPERPQLPTESVEPEPKPVEPEPTPPVENTPPPDEDTSSEPVDPVAPVTEEPGPPTDETVSGTGPGGAPGPIAQVGPTAVLGFDDASFTYSYYVDRMLAAIAAQWVRPPVGRDIELVVHFVITRNGLVEGLEIITPSGVRAFDRAGERAVLSASPLPPLPRSYRKDSLGVTLIIQ